MTIEKRSPEERGYQKSAFEVYFALGDKRSCAAVAEKLGRPKSTIKHWARKFEWRKRVDLRIAWQSEDKPEHTNNDQIEYVKRAIKFLDAALARMITHLAEGTLRASPQDLMALHRLEEEISERVDRRAGGSMDTKQTYIFLPDNHRDGPGGRVIPESQVGEYLDYLKYRD